MKKKIFIIAAIIATLSFVSLCLFAVLAYHACFGYPETNPDKLIKTLEERFILTFPLDIRNAKAAKYYSGFDGSMGFLLRFHTPNSAAESFLESLTLEFNTNLEYSKEKDDRHGYPEWFKTPIQKGQIFRINIKARKDVSHAAYYSFEVWIDTSNENESIIHMSGPLNNRYR